MPHKQQDRRFHHTTNKDDDSIAAESPSSQKKVEEYAHFLDQVLRPELKVAKSKVEEIELELSEYQQLGAVLQEQIMEQKQQQNQQPQQPQQKQEQQQISSKSKKMVVDLGYQTVYSQAEMFLDNDDNYDLPVYYYVNVGLGFHVQMTVPEAIAFVEQRMEFLRTQVLPHRMKQMNQVESHVQSSIQILEELEKVQEMMMTAK